MKMGWRFSLSKWSFTAAAGVWWYNVWAWGSTLDLTMAVIFGTVAVAFWCEEIVST